jgi:hypothetical protein
MKILRPEVLNCAYIKEPNNLFRLFDQIYMAAFNITSDELDILVEKMTEEELELWSDLLTKPLTFPERKKIIKLRNKQINYFYEKNI